MTTLNKSDLVKDIKKLQRHEKVTKEVLGKLSRDLLVYIEGGDVGMVTRLLKVLTPVNQKIATMYFPNFMGYKYDPETMEFGAKLKGKVYNKKHDKAVEFLSDELNNIWTYAEKEIEIAPKPKQYASKLTALVTKALKDEAEGLSVAEVMYAILASEELTLADVMQPLTCVTKDYDYCVA